MSETLSSALSECNSLIPREAREPFLDVYPYSRFYNIQKARMHGSRIASRSSDRILGEVANGPRITSSPFVYFEGHSVSDRLFYGSLARPIKKGQFRRFVGTKHDSDSLIIYSNDSRIVGLKLKDIHRRVMRKNFQIPSDAINQRVVLSRLLDSLSNVRDSTILSNWLSLIAQKGVSVEDGFLPDNHALDIFRQLIGVDRNAALASFEYLLDQKNAPKLSPGYFQLSLLGALMSSTISEIPKAKWIASFWIEKQIRLLRDTDSIPNETLRLSLIAGLIGLQILNTEDSAEEGVALAKILKHCLSTISTLNRRRRFLQFLADSVDAFLPQSGVADNWHKLLVLYAIFREQTIDQPRATFVQFLQHLNEYLDLDQIKKKTTKAVLAP